MFYVVELLLDTEQGEVTDYKVFTSSVDAEKRYYAAFSRVLSGEPVRSKSQQYVEVLRGRVFETHAADAEQAMTLVREGSARILMDTENELDLDIG